MVCLNVQETLNVCADEEKSRQRINGITSQDQDEGNSVKVSSPRDCAHSPANQGLVTDMGWKRVG